MIATPESNDWAPDANSCGPSSRRFWRLGLTLGPPRPTLRGAPEASSGALCDQQLLKSGKLFRAPEINTNAWDRQALHSGGDDVPRVNFWKVYWTSVGSQRGPHRAQLIYSA